MHQSIRTSSSINMNPVTGERIETVRAARLDMRMVGSLLVIRFDSQQIKRPEPLADAGAA